jgi:hypothetical protein
MRINEMSHPTGDKRKGDVRYVPGYVSLWSDVMDGAHPRISIY